MDYLLVILTALTVSGLTLFSGFGMGTLLMPAFALFFPAPTAVAATAVVHLAGNVFKFALVGRQADWSVTLRFALPAALAALAGAMALGGLADLPVLGSYTLGGRTFAVEPVKLALAGLILLFGLAELTRALEGLALPPAFIPLGGLLSGFFGGLSGHQGALRTAFLARAGLTKERLVGTMTASAVAVDCVRLGVYGAAFQGGLDPGVRPLVLAGCVAAFAGAFVGKRLLARTTLAGLHRVVGAALLALAVALGLGWV